MSTANYKTILEKCEKPFIKQLNNYFNPQLQFRHSNEYEDIEDHIDCHCFNTETNKNTTFDFKFLGYLDNPYNYNKKGIWIELKNKIGKSLSLYGKQDYFWYHINNHFCSYIINRRKLQNYIDEKLKNGQLQIVKGLSGSDLIYIKVEDLPPYMYSIKTEPHFLFNINNQ